MGCGCNKAKQMSNQFNGSDLLLNKKNRQEILMTTYISSEDFESGDFFTLLKFARCADKEAFDKAFEKVGIEIESDDDLRALAQLNKDGRDKDGTLQQDGQSVIFDAKEIFSTIKVRHENLAKCNIQFTK